MYNITNASAPINTTHLSYEGVYDSNEVHILYSLMYILSAVIVLPGIFGNGLIILAVMKLQNLRTPTNQLIASLALADLLIVLSMIAFVLLDRFPISSLPADVTMFLFPSIDMMLGTASIWNLAAVSIDRGIAVMHPLRYKGLVNSRRVRAGAVFIWMYAIAIFVLGMLRIHLKSEKYSLSLVFSAMIANFVLPCFLIVIIYIGIFTAAIKSIKMAMALEKAIHLATKRVSEQNNENSRRNSRFFSREIKVALNVMIILVPLVAGWGFYFGTHWYELITDDYDRSHVYEFCLLVIPWINSSLNPVVYVLATPSLRKGCKKLLQCGRSSKDGNSVFNTGIWSSLTSRRPSWLERSTSVERKRSIDSRRGSSGYRRKSSAGTFLVLDAHIEEDQTSAVQL